MMPARIGNRPASSLPYRGEDRRSTTSFAPPPPWLATLAIVLAVALPLLGIAFPAMVAPAAVVDLLDVAGATAAVAGVVVAGICAARWRAVGDAPALWFGLGLLLYGIGGARIGPLLGLPAAESGLDLAGALPPASLFVALLLFAAGATTPAVDTRLRPSRLVPAALFALGAFTILLAAASPTTLRVADAALVIPAAGLAWASLRRGLRERRWLPAWSGVCLFVPAVGALLPSGTASVAVLAAETLRLIGLLVAVHAVLNEMVRSLREQSARLLRSQVAAQRAEELVRSEYELAQERAHEARSALAAIEGATSTLERHRERLPADVRRQLTAAVSGEIRRLQALITPTDNDEALRPFELVDVLAPLLAVEQARGARVSCQTPAGLVATGRPAATAEVLQTLLDNARRHAPGSPVLLRADRHGDTVVVRVEDRGPGVAPAQRTAIFERGVRAARPGVNGEGIGLYVAARLAREQNGRLWVEERPGGGASFALALPAFARPQLVDQPAHLLERV